jgi:hypothetical protein
MPPGEAQYIAATDRPVVLELVQRLRAAERAQAKLDNAEQEIDDHWRRNNEELQQRAEVAEAIVRDLAAVPVTYNDARDIRVIRCSLCGQRTEDHDPKCLYRRAVEATK